MHWTAELFFSREVKGAAGEDLVEKQNAEQGLMPVVANETADYGYEAENRYFVNCFLDNIQPEVGVYDGLEVTQLLMACYQSAEQERTIEFKPKKLDKYIPAVARGKWKPCRPLSADRVHSVNNESCCGQVDNPASAITDAGIGSFSKARGSTLIVPAP